jgi:uracil-DNA glycosylase
MEMTHTDTWTDVLSAEKKSPYFKRIMQFLKQAHLENKCIYPQSTDIFNALKFTPYQDVSVVIIGQDPYHGPNQAHGLSFSVQPGIKPPPSLQNIFKELHSDLGIDIPKHGCLEKWAKQGVLLLNAALTVEANKPQSHADIGWHQFTDSLITKLNDHPQGIVFLLWGSYAHKKARLITSPAHHLLKTTHPSPLSSYRGFLGSKHFSKTNQLLKDMGRPPIDWQLD